jgi:twitching motility protein PilU
MEQSTLEGGQTFDQALFDLYTEGRISADQALANADSANNIRIRIKNHDLKMAGKPHRTVMPGEENFRIEGVDRTLGVRRL